MEMTLEQRRALAMAQARLRAQATSSAPEEPMDPTAGMSKTQRVLANLGAGMADLGTGVKSLYTDMFGSEAEKRSMEQEIAEKRELDRRLAASITGGSALQMAGGVIPTLAIPAAPLAVNAGRLATLGASAGTGAAYGAIVPRGEGESRGTNMAIGGTVGAVLPLALSLGKSAVNQFRGTPKAAQEAAEAVTSGAPRGERQAVLKQTVEYLQRRAQQAPQNEIPLSVAARLGNPELARLEAGSRTRSGANWYDFDQNQARAVAQAFDDATAEAGELATRRASRQSNIETNKAAAFGAADAARFADELGSFRDNLQVAMRSPDSSNPAVLNMLRTIESEIERLGPDFGPQHLATIRHNLSGKGNSLSPNALQSAPRDSVATISVLQEVDDILNKVTNNRWQNVVSGYAKDTRPVDAAKAAGRVREAYYDTATGRVRGVAADPDGDIPKITEAGLGRALDAARGADKSTLLSDPARLRLETVLDALRRQNIVQGVKRSATAGGGSNTASDTIAAGAAQAAGDAALTAVGGPAAPVGRSIVNSIRGAVNARKDAALAKALQDENQLRRLLEYQMQREPGLNFDQSETLRVLRALRGQ